jgi:very-short-patch-repair endonuclease
MYDSDDGARRQTPLDHQPAIFLADRAAALAIRQADHRARFSARTHERMLISKLASPIEQMLMRAMYLDPLIGRWRNENDLPWFLPESGKPMPLDLYRADFEFFLRRSATADDETNFGIYPQCVITDYAVDFAILGRCCHVESARLLIAVECDGHDFHERTKEQAERDRSRDRALQLAGAFVLRFTGREIYRDAAVCAAEVSKVAGRWVATCQKRYEIEDKIRRELMEEQARRLVDTLPLTLKQEG